MVICSATRSLICLYANYLIFIYQQLGLVILELVQVNENLFDGGSGKTLKRFHVEEEVVRKSLRDPDKVMGSQLASLIHSLKPARIFHSTFSYTFGYPNIILISKLIVFMYPYQVCHFLQNMGPLSYNYGT